MTDVELDAKPEIENPPPGQSLAGSNIVIKKGDVIAHYNHWIGIWSVKRVVKASKPSNSFGGEVWQPEINYVSHDAVPFEGKSGASRNHYPDRPSCGFGQTGTRTLARDGGLPWYLVDMGHPDAHYWIEQQDELWADYADDEVAEKERVAGTPEAFEKRMAKRAAQADRWAESADALAAGFRQMAAEIREETRGRWIK